MHCRFIGILLGMLLTFNLAWGAELPVQERQLPNGLKIISLEKHDSPVVCVNVFYRVGSKHEQPGKTGLAHVLEHMMFKSTTNLGEEEYSNLIHRWGGVTNASTSFDRTEYFAIVASNLLELTLALEAERMHHLHPTPEQFSSELEVVKEERRNHYEDDPRGRLRYKLHQEVFKIHPYGKPTIGSKDDLEHLSYDDMMAFYHRFYHPANAFIVVVGDFITEQLDALVSHYFGSIPAGPQISQTFPADQPLTQEARFTLEGAVQIPLYAAAYSAPAANSPDALPLSVLMQVLSSGGSSRLQKIVQEEGNAFQLYSWYQPLHDPYIVLFFGMPLPGQPLPQLEQRIDQEIERLLQDGITVEELAKAKHQKLATLEYNRQSCYDLANEIGEQEIVSSWKDLVELSTRLDAVTVDEVNRVARKYLKPTARVVGVLQPAAAPEAAKEETR